MVVGALGASLLLLAVFAAVYTSDARADEEDRSCSNGVVVPNPDDNLALVIACEALLEGKDTLAGGGELNWSTDLPISEWERDVTATPVTVTVANGDVLILGITIRFDGRGLDGCIPTQPVKENTGLDIDIEARGLEICTWESGGIARRPYVEGECFNGIVVPNPLLRPHIVMACEALLWARHLIEGSTELHWSSDLPFREWRRAITVVIVELVDSSDRVVEYNYVVQFDGRGLDGCVPGKAYAASDHTFPPMFVVIQNSDLPPC